MQRNGRATPEGLYEIIYKGKGKMPGFGKDCAPRVSVREIDASNGTVSFPP
jgi:hypothetical protein